jgi:hypothetical protein
MGSPDARPIFNLQNLIHLQAGNFLNRAAGPFGFDLGDR